MEWRPNLDESTRKSPAVVWYGGRRVRGSGRFAAHFAMDFGTPFPMKTQPPDVEIPSLESEVERERGELLERVTGWLETPLLVLGLVWLGLLVIELVGKLTPPLEHLGGAIYVCLLYTSPSPRD